MSRRLLPDVEEDSRLKSMLNDFDKRYTGRDYSAKGDDNSVTPDMLDDLSKQSFPPCMRELHERLRANHKLFHGGRQQYGLFLKAIGLSLDNAVIFWREEFTKVMDNDKVRLVVEVCLQELGGGGESAESFVFKKYLHFGCHVVRSLCLA